MDQFQPVTFNCSAFGIPLPEISWIKFQNGENITLTEDSSITINDPIQVDDYMLSDGRSFVSMVNRLLVLSETVDGDNDRYICVASNAAGNVSRDFQLVVKGVYIQPCYL